MGHYRDCRDRVKAIEVRIDEIEKQQKERQKNIEWMAAGKCKHCGGEFRGVFNKKCVNCGRVKDYGY
jgi:predicted Zn-ribbon and HTH transcriptional regulator